MPTLNPYLTFNGNCRDAMNFYKDCLGGELHTITAGESPVASQIPPAMHDQLLHAELKTGNLVLMATDMQPEKLRDGNDVHLCLICKNETEARGLFDKLSAGGKVARPLHEMFFGYIGEFTDKFGKRWMVECDK